MSDVNVPQFVQRIYIVLASFVVCVSYYKTLEKAYTRQILVKEQVNVMPKIMYPSLTFCYKYKYGNKEVIQAYNSYFEEKWKTSSK